MTDSEFAKFVDEIVSLHDRYMDAFNTGDLNGGIAMSAGMVARGLAGLERWTARPLPDTVVLKGRKPERHPRLPEGKPRPERVRRV